MAATLSVVMPNYNHGRFIGEAIQSIVSQSFKPVQMIIVDDGSTDNSSEIIEEFASRYDFIKFLSNPENRGFFPTYMRGLSHVTGDYVFGAAADDVIMPGFFEKSMRLLEKHPEAGFCCTASCWMDEDGGNRQIMYHPIVSVRQRYFPPDRIRQMFLKEMGHWIIGNTVIYRMQAVREVFEKIPIGLGPLWDGFLCHALSLKHGACYVPEPLGCLRRARTSYLSAYVQESGRWKEINDLAINLMRSSTFRELFSEEYIEMFERSRSWLPAWDAVDKAQQEMMETISPGPERFFLAFPLKISYLLFRMTSKAYVLKRHKIPLFRMGLLRLLHYMRYVLIRARLSLSG